MMLVLKLRLKSRKRWLRSSKRFSNSVKTIEETIGITIVTVGTRRVINRITDAIREIRRSTSPKRSRAVIGNKAARRKLLKRRKLLQLLNLSPMRLCKQLLRLILMLTSLLSLPTKRRKILMRRMRPLSKGNPISTSMMS